MKEHMISNVYDRSGTAVYTIFQNGRHFSILLFPFKLALMASLSNVKFKRVFNLMNEAIRKQKKTNKQKNTKMAVILEKGVWAFTISSRRRGIVGAHVTHRECCKQLVK